MNHISEEYRKYLNSSKWRYLRERFLERDGYQCRVCGSSKNLEIHHINGHGRFHEDKRPESVMVLCHECHQRIHLYYDICDSLREFYNQRRREERRARGLGG